MWIRIQESKNGLEKKKTWKVFIVLSAGGFLFRAKGFSCSLDVLYGGLEKNQLQFFIIKILTFSTLKFFFFVFSHKIINPEPDPEMDPT
jgi:hypothetical protein